MGAVFKARQISMDRLVALKILPPKLAKDKTFAQRFIREARSAAKLNHPNIVQGIDVGRAGGYYYFAMELVDGITVRNLIEQEGRIEERRALDIVSAVARALEHAHAHGIIHRDIKPDNIMISRDGVVKLADLGLARSTDTPDTLTTDATVLGTPHYMSPEQARGETDIDTRADIYALGASLYHMVTGEVPFRGPTSGSIMAQHITQPVPPPREKNPALSRSVCELIERMMAKDPADRPQTPAELLAGVRDALEGKVRLRPSPTAPTRTLPGARRRPVRVRRQPTARPSAAPWIAAGCGALALLAIVIFLASRGGQKDPRPAARGTAGTRNETPIPRPTAQERAREELRKEMARLRASLAALLGKGQFAEARRALKAFAAKHPAAKGEIADLEAELTAKVQERYAAVLKAVEAAIKAKDFDKARKALEPVGAWGIEPLAERARKKLTEIDSREKSAELWARWDDLKARAVKLAQEGKFDDALKLLATARTIALDNIADLIAERTQAIEQARGKATDAAIAAYTKDSDRVWGFFKERKYAEADKLLAKLKDKPERRLAAEHVRADLEAAKLLGELWAAVQGGLAARKGKSIAIAGAIGTLVDVKDGQVTIQAGRAEVRRHIHQLTAAQALAYADLKGGPRSRLVEALFRLAEQENLDAAAKALDAAPGAPFVAIYRARLDRAIGERLAEQAKAQGWVRLFNGETLRGWRVAKQGGFARHGRVGVGRGCILLDTGNPATGIVCSRDVPTDNYELRLEAMRVGGTEDLCGILFPIGASHCYLGVGGWAWAGGKIALDQVDGRTGNDNITTRPFPVQQNRWYQVRLRVTPAAVTVWVDGLRQIELPRQGHKFSAAPGLLAPLKPLGIFTWRTRVACRNVLLRRVSPEADARAAPLGRWQKLFDRKSLGDWEVAAGSQGRVRVEKGCLVLHRARRRTTQVIWTGEFPKMDYEVAIEAARGGGNNDICRMTFPMGDRHSILGVHVRAVALLNVAGRHVYENPTRRPMNFPVARWFRLRLRVTQAGVKAWIEGREVISQPSAGYAYARPGYQPLSLATWDTMGVFRSILMRRLAPKPEGAAEELKPGK